MTASLIFACIWAVAANISAIIPSKDNHWTRAYLLIALGVPVLGWVTLENGPWVGMIVLAAGASMLRWPLIYLGRRVRMLVQGERNDAA